MGRLAEKEEQRCEARARKGTRALATCGDRERSVQAGTKDPGLGNRERREKQERGFPFPSSLRSLAVRHQPTSEKPWWLVPLHDPHREGCCLWALGSVLTDRIQEGAIWFPRSNPVP